MIRSYSAYGAQPQAFGAEEPLSLPLTCPLEASGRAQLLRTGGGFYRPDHGEPFAIDEALLRQILENTQRRARPIRCDFMHWSLGDRDSVREYRTAGWIDPIDLRIERWISPLGEEEWGLFAAVAWVEEARYLIGSGELTEGSAVINWAYRLPFDTPGGKAGELLGPTIVGFGLVDEGFFWMDPIRLYRGAEGANASFLYRESEDMTAQELLALIQALLDAGMSDDVIMTQVQAAISAAPEAAAPSEGEAGAGMGAEAPEGAGAPPANLLAARLFPGLFGSPQPQRFTAPAPAPSHHGYAAAAPQPQPQRAAPQPQPQPQRAAPAPASARAPQRGRSPLEVLAAAAAGFGMRGPALATGTQPPAASSPARGVAAPQPQAYAAAAPQPLALAPQRGAGELAQPQLIEALARIVGERLEAIESQQAQLSSIMRLGIYHEADRQGLHAGLDQAFALRLMQEAPALYSEYVQGRAPLALQPSPPSGNRSPFRAHLAAGSDDRAQLAAAAKAYQANPKNARGGRPPSWDESLKAAIAQRAAAARAAG